MLSKVADAYGLCSNVPDISVPEGKTEDDNLEVKVVGEKDRFDFEPKSHVDLMNALSLAVSKEA